MYICMHIDIAIDTGIDMLRLQTRACATYSKYSFAESVHMHNADIHLHTYVHTYTHTYIRGYIHTYIPMYMHTYIHMYIHTQNFHRPRLHGQQVAQPSHSSMQEFQQQRRPYPCNRQHPQHRSRACSQLLQHPIHLGGSARYTCMPVQAHTILVLRIWSYHVHARVRVDGTHAHTYVCTYICTQTYAQMHFHASRKMHRCTYVCMHMHGPVFCRRRCFFGCRAGVSSATIIFLAS